MTSEWTASLVGVYTEKCKDEQTKPFAADAFTTSGQSANKSSNDNLLTQLNNSKPVKCCEVRILYNLPNSKPIVGVVGIGPKDAAYDVAENRDESHENIRQAIAFGVNSLRSVGATEILVDECNGHAQAAAEGAHLAIFTYNEEKSKVEISPKINPLSGPSLEWERGVLYAKCQNISRRLADMPCNLLNPTLFAKEAEAILSQSCKVIIHDEEWALKKGMRAFLSVNAGSATPAKFLEVHVDPEKDTGLQPLALVGKGVCFDTGGISLKPSLNMDAMRADMMGAACLIAAVYGISQMKAHLKRKIVLLVPMVENCPGPKATKPGDIVRAMNGKSIKIDNTDAEGRLILCDALCYADEFKPEAVMDCATLTGAVKIALGVHASAVYTNNEAFWKELYEASSITGDRVWRMPLWQVYAKQMTKCTNADLNNIAVPNNGGGSCVAAGFLSQFTECKKWAHVDIAGVMNTDGTLHYVKEGMSGRPTRTILQWLLNYDN